MSAGPEYFDVEAPFIAQLVRMGWKHIPGNVDNPTVTGRESFRDVLLKSDLRAALQRVNLRQGKPWLDDERSSQAVSALERIAAPNLIEANQQATKLLLEGIAVDGLPDWDHGRSQTIHYIDWEHPENNNFTVINQFRVDCPAGYAKKHITPDIVLFVNGIPVVLVECKAPNSADPLESAVDQIRRYSNQRKDAGTSTENEGNERLFYTNQFVVATHFDDARVGTIGADVQHYLAWKDTAPVPLSDVQGELNKTNLSLQERLIAGMLRKTHLLDIIRHFTLYQQVEGRTVKVVGRYQQFRAVQAAVHRLLHGKTRAQDGEYDRRGGIVWHTQGSGKSLTMVFLIKKIRSIPALRRFKIVIVTDRKDLQQQLADTAALTGETVNVAKAIKKVKKLLEAKGPGIVFATIQKYAGREDESITKDVPLHLGELNDDESILVLVDEAHRSHSSGLHASLLQSLPNCARIGFTGTPILMGAKKRTHDIFGEFLDRYTLKEAEADGSVVRILYEGRTAPGAVSDGRDLDQLFEDMLADRTPEELAAIQRKYATKGNVFEAQKLIEAKARDMMRHYVEHVLPNGLKAQVVAYSRFAALRYNDALPQARDELVKEAEALSVQERALDDAALAQKPRKLAAAVRAYRNLDMLRSIEFAAVISPGTNDTPDYESWTDAEKIEARIQRFKLPLRDAKKTDPLAFLIVKSMLLTGFDAPVEGVMYLDRPIREAELLQAIARVNRTRLGKTAGFVVDYYGVAHHLKDALKEYNTADIEGVLQSLKDEIPKLRDRHERVMGLFTSRGHDIADKDDCIHLLKDERLRAEFTVKLKQFLETLDLVLPRPEALPYVKDAKALGEIYERARTLYRDGPSALIGKDVGNKVRRLIDDHVISLGINPKIAPIAITDVGFAEAVGQKASPRAKASEMEHAVRHHIRKHLHEDPVFYEKLSERLDEILKKHKEDWEQLVLALAPLVEEAKGGRKKDDLGLDPATQAPLHALLKAERQKEQRVTAADEKWLGQCTVELVEHIQDEARLVGFWKNPHAQEVLRGQVFAFLDEHEIVDFDRAEAVADKVMEWAKASHDKLMQAKKVDPS